MGANDDHPLSDAELGQHVARWHMPVTLYPPVGDAVTCTGASRTRSFSGNSQAVETLQLSTMRGSILVEGAFNLVDADVKVVESAFSSTLLDTIATTFTSLNTGTLWVVDSSLGSASNSSPSTGFGPGTDNNHVPAANTAMYA